MIKLDCRPLAKNAVIMNAFRIRLEKILSSHDPEVEFVLLFNALSLEYKRIILRGLCSEFQADDYTASELFLPLTRTSPTKRMLLHGAGIEMDK